MIPSKMPVRTQLYIFTIILIVTTAGATALGIDLWYHLTDMALIPNLLLFALNAAGTVYAAAVIFHLAPWLPNLPEQPDSSSENVLTAKKE